MKVIDIRSDTVTKPTREMLEAIMNAQVGDDVFGEDPTVNELQRKCADITGKEKALFVPTGCMGNQLAIKSHTSPCDEVICEMESHIFNYETAAPAVLSRVQLMTVEGTNGIMDVSSIKKYIRPKDYYFPVSRLICIENTHNRAGGVIQPIENVREISSFARENGIKVHMDGARIFNACVETGITVKEYASYVDSISFCFSKGLGAPVGSILCGDEDFIARAHKWRKIIGGGMRQAGVLAAAAMYALENNVERLIEDNKKAKFFAEEIDKIDGINVDADMVHTNIVIFASFNIPKKEYISKLREKGVLISSGSYDLLRAVFHLDVSFDDVYDAVDIMKTL